MLFTREFKEGIRAGRITRTYRTWKRPQAKPGGRYNLAPSGVIEVDTVALVKLKNITDADAELAGFETRKALVDFLTGSRNQEDARLFQIDFRYLGSGAVRVPVKERLATAELQVLTARLTRMDDRSESPWTSAALELIGRKPAIRAADLAPDLAWETSKFKSKIRKLKGLGLTISLDTGYRLSPRGKQVLEVLQKRQDPS
jgi:hypothetical protein